MADAFRELENNTNLSQSSTNTDNRGDPRGEYPNFDYFFRSSIETGDYQLHLGGGDPTIDIADIMATTKRNSSNCKNASVKRTKSGHVFMFDDAGGQERIILKHKNGTGIEMRQDGTMIMRAENNTITSVGGSSVFMIEGDLKVSCKNLEVDATGDLDMRVAGDYNLTVGGDKKETITGSVVETISKNKASTVSGNESDIILGTRTNTTLGNHNNIIKGNYDNTVAGDYEMSGKGKALFTSMTNVGISSPDINIGAADLTVIGAGGTIGGDHMQMYTRNLRAGGTVYADASFVSPKAEIRRIEGSAAHYTTFHGDLNGTAQNAVVGGTDTDPGSSHGFSIINATATDIDNNIIATKKPTADSDTSTTMSMSSYLIKGNYGVQQVLIDEGDYIKDKINIGPNTGFITEKPLTIKEIRTKLKDEAHNTNSDFINTLYANGDISSAYLKKIPPSISRSFDGEVNYIPHENIGSKTSNIALIKGSPQVQPILPDSRFNPMALEAPIPRSINLKTLLGVGIPLSTFCIRTTLGHLPTLEERLALARQLLLQAEVIKYKKLSDQFKDYQLVVAEGVYKATAGETLTSGSVPFLAQTGRAITYEMYDENNISSSEVLFNFATRLATNLFAYDKITLGYDKLDPNPGAGMNGQITVTMPEVDKDYNIIGAAQPLKKLETRFNNQVMSNTDLVQH
ncbi:hypothetical protein N8455_00080 [Candidatus Gracilibacteria bacterium]|nr:hypothetical protein [Candidatus Gracilibacteria bacterium]